MENIDISGKSNFDILFDALDITLRVNGAQITENRSIEGVERVLTALLIENENRYFTRDNNARESIVKMGIKKVKEELVLNILKKYLLGIVIEVPTLKNLQEGTYTNNEIDTIVVKNIQANEVKVVYEAMDQNVAFMQALIASYAECLFGEKSLYNDIKKVVIPNEMLELSILKDNLEATIQIDNNNFIE